MLAGGEQITLQEEAPRNFVCDAARCGSDSS